MDAAWSGRTRASLLLRIRQYPEDQAAWAQFVERYGPQVYAWCRRLGLQEADSEDVTQTVLTRLAAKLRTFEYDPAQRFRAWLKTLTQHAWSDFLTAQKRAVPGSADSGVWEALHSEPARDDLASALEKAFDQELLEAATERVRQRVEAHTWEAFRLTAVEGLSGADAAARLGVQVGTVFKAKSKVLRMLQEEVQRIEDGEVP